MKSETIEELMLFLCTSRFDLELQEAKEIQRFFSLNELEALKEEKDIDEKPDDIEIEDISDTEEQVGTSRDLIDIDDGGDEIEIDEADYSEPQLPESSIQPQPLTSGRKRKHVEDDMYQCY